MDAELLDDAMRGFGTDESVLSEIICTSATRMCEASAVRWGGCAASQTCCVLSDVWCCLNQQGAAGGQGSVPRQERQNRRELGP
eukprot:1580785-Rhodomonas_salina.3